MIVGIRIHSSQPTELRELPAILTALWEVNASRPLPLLGDPEPFFPNPSN
jgi:hypothetical protein